MSSVSLREWAGCNLEAFFRILALIEAENVFSERWEETNGYRCHKIVSFCDLTVSKFTSVMLC